MRLFLPSSSWYKSINTHILVQISQHFILDHLMHSYSTPQMHTSLQLLHMSSFTPLPMYSSSIGYGPHRLNAPHPKSLNLAHVTFFNCTNLKPSSYHPTQARPLLQSCTSTNSILLVLRPLEYLIPSFKNLISKPLSMTSSSHELFKLHVCSYNPYTLKHTYQINRQGLT